MSSDEEYANSEEENDEIAELSEIDEEERAKIDARGGKRRFSVSSESASSVKYAAPRCNCDFTSPRRRRCCALSRGARAAQTKPQRLPVGRAAWSAPRT